jgi:hypothetical protein
LLPVEQNESIEEKADFFWEETKGQPLVRNVYAGNGEQSVEDLLLDPPLADVPRQVRIDAKDNCTRVEELQAQQ